MPRGISAIFSTAIILALLIIAEDFFDHPSGCIRQCGPLAEETEHLDLPRLTFKHTRRQQALVRALIDRINGFDPVAAARTKRVDGAEVA